MAEERTRAERGGRTSREADLHVTRAALRSMWPLMGARLRRLGPARLLVAVLAASAAAAVTLATFAGLWRWVLGQVPLRAGHAPGPEWVGTSWIAAMAAATIAAALGGRLGAWLGGDTR